MTEAGDEARLGDRMLWVRRLEMPMKLLMVVVLAVELAAQKADPAAVLLEGAARKERVDGDLKGAIAEYRKIAAKFAKQPEVAAQALLKMGECQEKLGEAEARKSYERVVKEYAGAGAAVVQARARLAAMGGGGAAGVSSRRLVAEMPQWFTGVPNPTSPDGRLLFLGARDKAENWIPAILDLNSGQQRTIQKAPGQNYIDSGVISSDNRMIAYTAQPSANMLDLIVANLDGSSPRAILRTSSEISWLYPVGITPDNKSIIIRFNRPRNQAAPSSVRGYQLGRVDIATGVNTLVRKSNTGLLDHASLSPDGQWIAFEYRPDASTENADILVVRTDGSLESALISHAAHDASPLWSADGKGIYFVSNRSGSNDLWFVPVKEGKATGEERQLRSGIGNVELLGSTSSGSVLYRLFTGSHTFLSSTIDESTGRFSPFVRHDEAFSGNKRLPMVSPDEKLIAYIRQPEYAKGRAIIGVRDIASGKEREIFPNLRLAQSAIWMPDQRSFLVSGRDHKGVAGDFLVDAQSGNTRELPPDGNLGAYARVGASPILSPDGKTIYFATYKKGSGAMFSKDLTTGSTKLLFEGQGFVNFPRISADGRWIIYSDNYDPVLKRMLRIVSTADGSVRDIGEGLYCYGFSADSQSIFVISENDPQFKDRIATLYRMPLMGGEKVPVTEPLKGPDSLQVIGKTAVYRENTAHFEIWSLDNVMTAVK